MAHAPLLIEIGTEELPPKALPELAQAFADGLQRELARRGIAHRADERAVLWSPRRLAARIEAVADRAADQTVERRGPAVAAGLDPAGQPTRALLGFAASCGVAVHELGRVRTDKGEWFVHRARIEGAPLATLIGEIVAEALRSLPVPKQMRWGDHDWSFVRPVHWLVALHGDEVLPFTLMGHTTDRMSRGHRFHADKKVWIGSADDYVDALRGARVLVDPAERRAVIRAEVERAAAACGGKPRLREALLEEVANLVEWPRAIACSFERAFLAVPQEALIMTMESNQKFFPVFDSEGRLSEHFIGIANIESRDPAEVRKGFERVIRPRFADAKFFYDEDLKTPLAEHQRALENVTYQLKLGSVWDKCCRVAELARVIANRCGVDAALATQAAALAKCDLMTRMVGEFPELQGTMGRYYALAQGVAPAVAAALDEFYAPRQSGDAIAASALGRVLAIAERLDTLAGLFAIGQKPTGNKDPFSLRRAALGLARTLIEGGIELDLRAQLQEALDLVRKDLARIARERAAQGAVQPSGKAPVAPDDAALAAELYAFVIERLRGYYAEQGIPGDCFEAVAALEVPDLADFDRRLRALHRFVDLPEAAALAAANKRTANLLRQAAERGEVPAATIDVAALVEREEQALAAALADYGAAADAALVGRDYLEALRVLAKLRPAVDAFFERVMVMAPEPLLRRQRLGLLAELRRRFGAIADLSLLPG